MSDEFYNPFAFVPVEKPKLNLVPRKELAESNKQRFQHLTHDRYVSSSKLGSAEQEVYSGTLLCRLSTVTPTVVGGIQHSEFSPSIVHPYFQLNKRNGVSAWEPAIPSTSLRGLYSSIVEASTNSAMRVLTCMEMSMRMDMNEGLHAVGRIVTDFDGKRSLQPLSFPRLSKNGASFSMPNDLENFAHQMGIRIYLDDGKRSDNPSRRSFTPDNPEIVFLKLGNGIQMDGNGISITDGTGMDKGGLVGRRFRQNLKILSRDAWEVLKGEEKKHYKPGIIRNLGRESEGVITSQRKPELNGPRSFPPKVKDFWFIPLSETIYNVEADRWIETDNTKIDCEEAATLFEEMAKLRTADKAHLPYELKSSNRNDKKKRSDIAADHEIKLRTNDLVCFQLSNTGGTPRVSAISISSIWRRPAGNLWKWFEKIDKNLVPMNPNRTEVTLAEQMFGFVDQNESGNDDSHQANRLAGRIRFSDATKLGAATADCFGQSHVAKTLSSPKLPSPFLYFDRPKEEPKDYKFPSGPTSQTSEQPLGRKWYLHHDDSKVSWESEKPHDDKMKARLTPLRPGLDFIFSIKFDNFCKDELSILLYSLEPSDSFHHKLGMAKPHGLGSVKTQLLGMFLVNRESRYTADSLFQEGRFTDVSLREGAKNLDADLLAENAHAELDQELNAIPRQDQADSNQLETLLEHGRALVQKTANNANSVVTTLGDPESTKGTAVHYPRLTDECQNNDLEGELFKWHVYNKKRPSHRQGLSKLSAAKPMPAKLSKIAPFHFYLYNGLSNEEFRKAKEILRKFFPGQWEEVEELPNDSKHYEKSINSKLKMGMIPIHIGISDLRNVDKKHWVGGYKPPKPTSSNPLKQLQDLAGMSNQR